MWMGGWAIQFKNENIVQDNKLVVLNDIRHIIIERMEKLIIEFRDGKKLIVEPGYIDNITMCKDENLFYFDCIENHLMLRIVNG